MTKTALIMATYNGEKYLKGQLDSIVQQEVAPDIVLFRDDASTDGTIVFLKRYITEHALKNWFVQKNAQNLGWRRNFRQLLIDVQAFEPDFVFFADQDDCWRLDKNGRQLEVMAEKAQIELLTGDFELVRAQEKVSENHYPEFPDKEKELSQYPFKISYRSYRPGWTMLVRNQLIKEVLPYWKEDVVVNHDALLEGIACLLGSGYNLNSPVGTHLRHEGNASGKPIISLKSSKAEHIKALYDYRGFYAITYQLLVARASENAGIAKKEFDFYKRRYDVAESRKKLRILGAIFREWKNYESMSGRLRDFIFTFKK
jgi:glycosyltransferase involved in cell wall biosynthesis